MLPSCLRSCFLAVCLLLPGLRGVAQQPAEPAPAPPAKTTPSIPLTDSPPSLTLPPPKMVDLPPGTLPPPSPPVSLPTEGAPDAKKDPSPAELPAPVPPPAAPKKTLTPAPGSSSAGQFSIYGADLQTRTWMSNFCQPIADELALLLRDNRPGAIPIVIKINTPPNIVLTGPAVTHSFAQLTEGGFHLQITIQSRPDFNTNDLRSELVLTLLAERILRDHNQITTKRSRVLPDWLTTGVMEAMRYRQRSRPSTMFAAVFKSGKVYGIDEVLDVTPSTLDSLSRNIYEVSSCALVMALLDQPEGGMRMSKFLNSLAVDNRTDRELISAWFPGVAQSKTSLEKWWSLQMANLSRPTVFENLDPVETQKALDNALQLRFAVEPDSTPAKKKSSDSESRKPEAGDEEDKAASPSFFARLFGRGTDEEPKDKEKDKEKPKPAPAPAPKDKPKPMSDEEIAKTSEGGGFHLRNLFGGGSSSDSKDADKKKDDKPKPKPEPKKEEPPKKPEPKKEEPKKEPEPKKPEPKKEEKKDATPKDEPARSPGILRRLFGSGDKEADKPKDKDKPKESEPDKPKEKTKAQTDEEPAKPAERSTISPLPRMRAEVLLQTAFPVTAELVQWLHGDSPRYTFLGFGKKKTEGDDKKDEKKPEPKKDDKAKAKPKADAKKEEPKKEDSKKPEPKKPEPKKEEPKKADPPKPEPKKPAPEPKKPEPKKTEPAKPSSRQKSLTAIPLDEYAKIMKRSDAKAILTFTAKDLAELLPRAHPLFRPIIASYIVLLSDIAEGRAKDAPARLKDLAEKRAAAFKQARDIQAFLDLHEVNQTSKWSDQFDDYLKLPHTIDQELPKRADPISTLLDETERELKGR